jgi:hypothetical protein
MYASKLHRVFCRLSLCVALLSGLQVSAQVYNGVCKVKVHGTGTSQSVGIEVNGGSSYFGSFNTAHNIAGYAEYTFNAPTMWQGWTLRAFVSTDFSGPKTVALGQTLYEFDVYFNGATPEQHWKFTDCQTNKKNYPVTLEYRDENGDLIKSVVIQPGAEVCTTLGPYPQKKSIVVGAVLPTGTRETLDGLYIPDSDGNWYDEGAATPRNDVLEGILGWLSDQPPIDFPQGTSDLARESTVQAGFLALNSAAADQLQFTAMAAEQAALDAAVLGAKIDAASAINQSQMNTLGASVSGLSSGVAGVKTSVDAVGASLASVASGVSSLNAGVSAGNVLLGGFNSKFDAIANGGAAGNQLLSAMDTKMAAQNATLNGILNKQDSLAGIGSGIGTGNAWLQGIAGGVGQVAVDVGYSKGYLADIKADVGAANAYAARTANATEAALAYEARIAVASEKLANALEEPESELESQVRIRAENMLAEWQDLGQQYSEQAKVQWDEAAAAVQEPAPVTGSAGNALMLNFGRWGVLNVDPMQNGALTNWAYYIKKALEWGVSIIFIFGIIKVSEGYLRELGSVQQTRAPRINATVLGFGGDFGIVAAVPWAIAITVAIGILPTFILHYIMGTNAPLACLSQHPLTNAPEVVKHLLLFFLPVQFILAHIASYFIFRLSIAGVYMGVITAVRFVVGG